MIQPQQTRQTVLNVARDCRLKQFPADCGRILFIFNITLLTSNSVLAYVNVTHLIIPATVLQVQQAVVPVEIIGSNLH